MVTPWASLEVYRQPSPCHISFIRAEVLKGGKLSNHPPKQKFGLKPKQ